MAESIRIILVISNSRGVSQALVTDDLRHLLLNDKTSIQFAAAYLSFIKKFRAGKNLGTSAAEVASSYSYRLSGNVRKRGQQINLQLRKFAREILD